MTTELEYEAFIAGMHTGAEHAIQASGLRNPEGWLVDTLGGIKADSGVRVDYRSSMSFAYVYAASSIIAGDVASLPLNVYQREADGDEVVRPTHPAHWLLNGDASPTMSAYELRETLTHHALLMGNGFAKIHRNGGGQAEALELLDPRQVVVHVDRGLVTYRVTLPDQTYADLEPSEVLHIHGLGFDGHCGHSVLYLARNSLGLGLAQEKHGGRHFKNGAQPSLVLKHPKPLVKEQADELLETFALKHAGSENTGKPALASGGLDIQVLPINNQDAQWLESRKFTRAEVAVWFGLPPHKLGDDSKTAYNSLESENRAYITQTLRRWLRRWEDECSRKLVAHRQRRSFSVFLRHDPKPLVETNMAEKVEIAVKLKGAMVWTANEARVYLGSPRIEGGDTMENPHTTSGGGAAPEPEPPPAEQNEAVVEAVRNLAADRLGKVLAAMGSEASRAAAKPDEFNAYLGAVSAKWTPKVAEALSPYADQAAPLGLTVSSQAGSEAVAAAVSSLWDAAGSATAEQLPERVAATVTTWADTAAEIMQSAITWSE